MSGMPPIFQTYESELGVKMSFISYAQNFEDVMLHRALARVPQGFYVDVGAGEPNVESVTRAFYEGGWRGINVEPLVSVFDRIQLARERDINLNVAVTDSVGEATFFAIDGSSGLSTSDPKRARTLHERGHAVSEVTIRTTTLAEICRAHVNREVHFLKIDVEGLEEKVLRGADFDAVRPWIIVAESEYQGQLPPRADEWESILLDARYVFAHYDGLNRYYVSKERFDELSAAFSVGPNLFDDFVLARVAELEDAQQSVGKILGLSAGAQTGEIMARLDSLAEDRIRYEKLANGLQLEVDMLWQSSFEDGRHVAWLTAEVDNLSSRGQLEANALRAETDEVRAELAQVRAECDVLESEIERFRAELLEARVEAHGRARELEALHGSTSWALTRPFRGISRRLRPMRSAP
jgi:FkbM family methyltransferase